MGMLDSLDGVLDAYIEITEAANELGEKFYEKYGKIDFSMMSMGSVDEVANALRASFAQIKPLLKKYESDLRGEVEDDSVMDKRFQSIALQAITRMKISGAFSGVEGGLIFDLHGNLLSNIMNVLNSIRSSGRELPDSLKNAVNNQIDAIKKAQKMTEWLVPRDHPGLPDLESSIEWVKEVIKRRRESLPYAIEQYVAAKNMLKLLKDVESGDYERKREAMNIIYDSLDEKKNKKNAPSVNAEKIIAMIDTAIKIYEALDKSKNNTYSNYNTLQINKLNEYRRIFNDMLSGIYDITKPNIALFYAQKAVEVSELLANIAIQFFSEADYYSRKSGFYSELENLGVADKDVAELLDLYEMGITSESAARAGISGASAIVQTGRLNNIYRIDVVADNKTQTITTLNDPADFLAALTEL